MPRHMPRTAHEPRGVNKIHGLVVAVETEQLNRRLLFTILYLAAGKQRQIVVGIASLSLYFCPGNRATCPCSSDGRASTNAMSVVRLHPRATCTQYQAVFKGLSDICKCGVIGSTSDFHSDSAGSNPVICSMTLWSAKQINSAGGCSGLPVTCPDSLIGRAALTGCVLVRIQRGAARGRPIRQPDGLKPIEPTKVRGTQRGSNRRFVRLPLPAYATSARRDDVLKRRSS